LRIDAKLAQRKYSSIEILLLKCKIMVRGRSSNKSGFVDYDPVRARAEGLAPAGMDAGTTALFPDGFEEMERDKSKMCNDDLGIKYDANKIRTTFSLF